MSFVAEPGWYHEAHEAFVPDRTVRGRGLFLFEAAEKAPLQRSQSLDPFDVPQEYASGIVLPAALQVRLFEQSQQKVEVIPWNG